MGGMEGTEPETSCGYVVIGQEAIDLSCNTGKKQLDIKRYLLVWDFFFITRRLVKTLEQWPREVVQSPFLKVFKSDCTKT